MTFLIFNAETRIIMKRGFRTERGARIAATRLGKKERYNGVMLDVADEQWFNQNVEQMVERTNLMTGKKFMQPLNTPRCCDPSTELYWSM